MQVNKQHSDLVTVTLDTITVEIHGNESRLPETLCITHESRAEELATIDLSPFTTDD